MRKLIRRLTRKYYNSLFKRIMSIGYDKLYLNSYEMHELIGMWDREVYPEYHKKNVHDPVICGCEDHAEFCPHGEG